MMERTGEARSLRLILSSTHRLAERLLSNFWIGSVCQGRRDGNRHRPALRNHDVRYPPSAPCDWRAVLHRPGALSGRGGLLVPVENNRWQVNLTGMHGQLVPESVEEFIAFAKTLRTQQSMTRSRTLYLLDRFTGLAFPAASGDTLRDLTAFQIAMLPLGDVICRFNPAFGQGMSVAAQEVSVLKRLIEAQVLDADPFKRLAQSFFAAI